MGEAAALDSNVGDVSLAPSEVNSSLHEFLGSGAGFDISAAYREAAAFISNVGEESSLPHATWTKRTARHLFELGLNTIVMRQGTVSNVNCVRLERRHVKFSYSFHWWSADTYQYDVYYAAPGCKWVATSFAPGGYENWAIAGYGERQDNTVTFK